MKVLVTGVRAPAGVHCFQALSGMEVEAAECIRFPLVRAHRFPPPQFQFQGFQDWLYRYIRKTNVDWIVPTCEDVIHTAQALEDIGEHHRLFAPSAAVLERLHNKQTFIEQMIQWGLPVPVTIPASQRQSDPGRYVFKPVYSRFATKVICGPQTWPDVGAGWIAQERCEGIECCVYALCYEGRLLGHQAYRPVVRAGKGAGIGLRPVLVPGLEAHLERFAGKSGWTGQVSFDLFYHRGRCQFIECNPRATSGIHWFEDLRPALRGEACPPTREGYLQVTAAMPVFGKRGPRYDVVRQAPDVCLSPVGMGAQIRTMAELMTRGVLRGEGILEAATWGIAHQP